MHILTKLIKEDMKPALGVTEPGAIAYAAALAREHTAGRIEKVEVALNSGMYKNAFTCGIPNSSRYGNLYAAALGAVAAKAERGLESLAEITPEDDEAAARLVEEGRVKVTLDHIGSEITIDAAVEAGEDRCEVHIRGSHTHVSRIEKNGISIYEDKSGISSRKEAAGREEAGQKGERPEEALEEPAASEAVVHRYTLHRMLEYVNSVPAEELDFIREAYAMNLELLREGLRSERAVIAAKLLRENDGKLISGDIRRTAQLLCSGAIEARVLGLDRPAMSITGSGAHGIIGVMPLYACYESGRSKGTEKEAEGNPGETTAELLLRASALSCLITMYIKEYSGKLSAFCGCGIAAGTGMACGLAYMQGADEEQITMVIQNMASGLTGMICDGGNHGCAMKGIVAVDAAFRAVDLAMDRICIEAVHGINGKTAEDTMRHMGLIASPGMTQTERVIVEIMERK